jgi:hypothetical protein
VKAIKENGKWNTWWKKPCLGKEQGVAHNRKGMGDGPNNNL